MRLRERESINTAVNMYVHVHSINIPGKKNKINPRTYRYHFLLLINDNDAILSPRFYLYVYTYMARLEEKRYKICENSCEFHI